MQDPSDSTLHEQMVELKIRPTQVAIAALTLLGVRERPLTAPHAVEEALHAPVVATITRRARCASWTEKPKAML